MHIERFWYYTHTARGGFAASFAQSTATATKSSTPQVDVRALSPDQSDGLRILKQPKFAPSQQQSVPGFRYTTACSIVLQHFLAKSASTTGSAHALLLHVPVSRPLSTSTQSTVTCPTRLHSLPDGRPSRPHPSYGRR